jgi:hypothetical protein
MTCRIPTTPTIPASDASEERLCLEVYRRIETALHRCEDWHTALRYHGDTAFAHGQLTEAISVALLVVGGGKAPSAGTCVSCLRDHDDAEEEDEAETERPAE